MATRPIELAVVMPVYNEEGAIGKVVGDWIRALDALGIAFEIHAYDDGSRDRTAEILESLERQDPRVRPHRKANSGHGPTILMGYRDHCDKPWLFQIDSDDEMKPDHFAPLWAARADHDILIGERERIGQPWPRQIVSAVSRATVHGLFGSAIRDVNAPYRLMRSAFFAPVFRAIPDDSFAPNLLVSGAAAMLGARVFRLPVPQTQRTTGEVSIRKWRLLKAAFRAFRQTITAVARIRRLRSGFDGARGASPAHGASRGVPSLVPGLGLLLLASLAMNVITARDRDAVVAAQRAAAAPSTPSTPVAGAALEVDSESLRQLAALGYAEHATTDAGDDGIGVDRYDASRAADGLNVAFEEWGCKKIEFFRNDGTVVRTLDVSALRKIECYELKPLDDGFLFLTRPVLYRLDLDGQVVWQLENGFYFHHDADATAEKVVALETINVDDPDNHGGMRYEDRLVVLRPDGRVTKIVRLQPLFWDAVRALARSRGISQYDERAKDVLGMDTFGDFLHTNSVQILERDSAIGKRGNVLVSLRTIDTIATIDLEEERVVWSWGPGELDHQHHPQLLPNGNLLIFDNGWHRGHSRVLEVDPTTKKIVWQYAPEDPDVFFTKRRGGAFRLDDGNTLITESDRGRAFEITPDGTIVWQYRMPLADSHEDASSRQTLFRLRRLAGDRLARVVEAWDTTKTASAEAADGEQESR